MYGKLQRTTVYIYLVLSMLSGKTRTHYSVTLLFTKSHDLKSTLVVATCHSLLSIGTPFVLHSQYYCALGQRLMLEMHLPKCKTLVKTGTFHIKPFSLFVYHLKNKNIYKAYLTKTRIYKFHLKHTSICTIQ